MSYTNNKEYREALRVFFQMKCEPVKGCEDIEEETVDEFTYDPRAVEQGMNDIYGKTKEIPAFCRLYEVAAALMMSLDLETGLAVLLSYDYFASFLKLYERFNESKEEIEETSEYQEVWRLISRKR